MRPEVVTDELYALSQGGPEHSGVVVLMTVRLSKPSLSASRWADGARRAGAVLALAWALSLPSLPARAFTEPRTYFEPADEGGGGGRFFTGSPAEGYGCDVCHDGPPEEPLVVEGLPQHGYVPGQTYALRVSWPQFTARAQAQALQNPEAHAAMSLSAELITETGEGSGRLAVAAADAAQPEELCSLPQGTRAAQLYLVQPGKDVEEAGIECAAETLGERCVAAVLACGAQAIRMNWTAPDRWQGPIWFSAGLVTTADAGGNATGDRFAQHRTVLLPAASRASEPERRVYSGCRAAPRAGAPASGAGWLGGAGALLLWIGTRRRR